MKELSLNILDIAENSVKAKATLTEIFINETDETITVIIKDNGTGMTKETLNAAANPFYTTRTTRKVGMGLPLLKMEAEMCGGSLEVNSKHISEYPDEHGTVVTAVFYKNHIDCVPLGNVVETIVTLIQGHPETDFCFKHNFSGTEVNLDTRELKKVLEDVPLNSYEVLQWIRKFLSEQYQYK